MPNLLAPTLANDARQKLETWVRRPKTSPRLRSRIVLAAADGTSGDRQGLSRST